VIRKSGLVVRKRQVEVQQYCSRVLVEDLRDKRSAELTMGFSRYFKLEFWQGSRFFYSIED